MEIQYGALIGIYGGMFCGLCGWYFGRKKAAKKGKVDEMYEHVMKTSRSFSWIATICTIYILFTLHAIGIEMKTPTVLGIIMLVQLGSWGISGAVINFYLTVEKELNLDFLIGIFIIIASTTLFIVIAIISENWIFLFWPIPFGIIGFNFLRQNKAGNKGGS